jgi:hypothetical protein
MQSNSVETFLSKDIKTLLNNGLFSDIKLKGKNGKEINAHRAILAVRSEVFNSMLTNGMKESTQEVIEFPEFSSDILHVILEYLYTGRVTEQTLTIEIVAEVFHGADYFLLKQLKLQIIEFFNNHLKNSENKENLSAKVLSQLLDRIEPTNNEFVDLLCNSVNSVPLKSIEYCNLNIKALKYSLSKIKRKEIMMFALLEYELLHYIILWVASGISEEALSFYKSCLPSPETVNNLNGISNPLIDMHNDMQENHAKYQSTMMTKISPLLDYVKLEQIHPFIISNIIEPFNDLIDSKTLIDVYRKQALFSGKGAYLNCMSFQWSGHARGSNMHLSNSSPITSNSSSHEWIRTTVPISGQDLFEWDVVVEKICNLFWVGICTEKGYSVDYNSWLGKQAYGWVLGSNGVICHNTQEENGPYTNGYGEEFEENDRITVHLDMGERTCSFSINGERYPIAFRDLPDEIYPAISIIAPGRARIEPHQ